MDNTVLCRQVDDPNVVLIPWPWVVDPVVERTLGHDDHELAPIDASDDRNARPVFGEVGGMHSWPKLVGLWLWTFKASSARTVVSHTPADV